MTRHLPSRFERGYIILLALVFAGIFAMVSTALVNYVLSYSRAERVTVASTQALTIAEGALDNTIGQLNLNPAYSGETDTPLGGGTFTVTLATVDTETKRVTVTAYVPNSVSPTATKTVQANVGINNSNISFHYGIQSGEGGFVMENPQTKVFGNVYSSGSVTGGGGNMIYGDVISSGPNGLVYGIHATSSVYAHTIGKSDGAATIVDKDAYYATIKINTTVHGTSYPNSPNQGSVPLPISDEQISEWEAAAEAGGTAVCSGGKYEIASETVSLGPVKIPCDLLIKGSSVVTIQGHIWVTGTISVENTSTVKMAASLGAENVAIIADNPSNRLTSSKIFVKNTATFQDSGTPGSFVFLISQNNSAETGGDEKAFELANSASALVAYAAHGLIPLANSVSLKEVTAYKIHLKNSANVIYDSGLPSAVFQSGPGGSWSFVPGSYAITR